MFLQITLTCCVPLEGRLSRCGDPTLSLDRERGLEDAVREGTGRERRMREGWSDITSRQ